MSDINPTNIDGSYPIAGQNQSSDGFRTNFTNIKSNLTFAKDEITDLQNKVLLKASLTGSTLDNDMDRSALTKAQLKNYSLSINAKGSVSGTVSLSPTDGNYVTMTLTDPATLAFDTNAGNYPAATSQAFIFFVQMTISDIAQTLTLPTSVNKGTTSLVGFNSGNRKITHTYTGTYIYQLITVDAGVSWSIIDLTNTASTVNATSATSTIGNMVLSGNTITTSGTNEPLRISPDATSATGYTIITGNLYVTNATRINNTYIAGSNIQALGSTANLTLDVETSSNWVVLSNQTEIQGNLNISQSNLTVTGGTIYTRGESYSWASTVTANASISSAGFYKVDFLDGSAKTVTLTLSPPVTDGDVVYVMVNSRAASQLANIVSGNATCNIYHAAGNVNGNVSVSTEIYGTVRLIGTKSQSTNKWVVASYTGNLTYV
jgi:hypothetical protein